MATVKVLVVDDEPAVLSLVCKALSAQGYEVHAVSGPRQALELMQTAPCFDLVVSDVIMPEMCGPELVRRITKMCPTIAVVMMSGYLAAEAISPRARFISKPFRMLDLYSVVASALALAPDEAS
jgi:CheY-like chemotaxis protein